MLDTLLSPLSTLEATVVSVEPDGAVVVRSDADAELTCRWLQTSDAPPPHLKAHDRVLVAAASTSEAGYLIGRITGTPCEPTVPTVVQDGRVVEVIVPEGVETVRIAGQRITIAADESLSLECGGGSVRIDKRGKVVVLGTDITSRAKRLHKVKGASVAIN